jgi:arginyl-tRNA synthetase
MQNQLVAIVKKVLDELSIDSKIDIEIYTSDNPDFGDYSTNIALQLSKLDSKYHHQSPLEIASIICEKLSQNPLFEQVSIAGPGFINLFIKPEAIAKLVNQIDENFANATQNKQKISIEYVSANPTGPLHFGNARGGPIGDSLANIFEYRGYQVNRQYLDNNIGGQINSLGRTIKAKITGENLNNLEYQGQYIDDLVRQLSDKVDLDDSELGGLAAQINFEQILDDCNSMSIRFDTITHESDLVKQSPQIVEALKSKGVVRVADGAVWLATGDDLMNDRETVLVKSDGSYGYFAQDIVYFIQKAKEADRVISVMGSNHHGHAPRILSAMEALGLSRKVFEFVFYQYVRIKRGDQLVKMSKRLGNVVSAREVLDEIGADAFRYSMVATRADIHIDLDLDLLKQQSSQNPVYYLQYAYARMSSIAIKADYKPTDFEPNLLTNKYEIELIKHLDKFPQLLDEIVTSLEVYKLAMYGQKLAQDYHRFYEHCPIITSDHQLSQARLRLNYASRLVLGKVLGLIGVSAKDSM